MDFYAFVVRLVVSFLIGSIPFAVVAMWGTGTDITKVGSRNPGFNNVLRVATRRRAAMVLVGDVSKGFVALWLLSGPNDPFAVEWSLGLAAVIGHCWSPLLGFKGGKGVATTVGILLYLEWMITAVCLILYPLGRIVGRRMLRGQEGAISSLITMSAITLAVLGLKGLGPGLFALITLGIVVVRHTPNLREVWARARK